MRDTARWVVFHCGGRRYGVPLERVGEITAPRPLTRLPGAGAEVCGLIGVRGRILTVLDLGVLLGGEAAAGVPDHRLLLLELEGRRIAAAVEAVVAVAAARLESAGAESGLPLPVLGRGWIDEVEFTALDPAPLLAQLVSV